MLLIPDDSGFSKSLPMLYTHIFGIGNEIWDTVSEDTDLCPMKHISQKCVLNFDS